MVNSHFFIGNYGTDIFSGVRLYLVLGVDEP